MQRNPEINKSSEETRNEEINHQAVEIILKQRGWNRLNTHMSKTIGKEKLESSKPDFFGMIPVCIGSPEMLTPVKLEALVSEIESKKEKFNKIDYVIYLCPKVNADKSIDDESLAKWYRDNEAYFKIYLKKNCSGT